MCVYAGLLVHESRSRRNRNTWGLYIEDCTFRAGGAATDAYHGARFVFRNNSVIDTHVAQHGCDSGGYRSTFSYEVYENRITKEKLGSWKVPRAMHFRGGTGVVFNNTLGGYTAGNEGTASAPARILRPEGEKR